MVREWWRDRQRLHAPFQHESERDMHSDPVSLEGCCRSELPSLKSSPLANTSTISASEMRRGDGKLFTWIQS